MNSRPGGPTGSEDFAVDRNGKPIVDRFGRPVRKRSPLPEPKSSQAEPRHRRALQRERGSLPPGEPLPPRESRTSRSRESIGDYVRSDRADRSPRVERFARPEASPMPPEYRRPSPSANSASPARAAGYGTAGYSAARSEPTYERRTPLAASSAPSADENLHIPSRREERAARIGGQAWEGRRRKEKPRNTPLTPRRGNNRAGRPRRKIGIFKILGALMAVFLLLFVGTAIWIDSSLQRTDALQGYDGRVGNTSGTNWLLVGSDSRAGMTAEDADRLMAGELDESTGRTDTIMLVHVPTFGGKPTMVSFPRDSWVNIPGHGEDKINQAFSLGGPALLQQTIEEKTGLRIDHYAEIGFGGFANVVDSVGGINMCLKEPLQDPMAGIDLQAGCQDMEGPTALGYVRSRYASANGDLDRVERQRQFLSAMSDKLSSPSTLLNPFRAFPAINALTGSLTVNDSDHVWHLGGLAMALARGANQETVPISGPLDTWAGSALQWDEAAAEELFASLR